MTTIFIHGAADRRCPVFLLRLDKMNKTKGDNRYKYYCTSDPNTWETFDSNEQELATTGYNDIRRETHITEEREGIRGRLGGGKRGEGEGTQREPDKGWEGMKASVRGGGLRANSMIQTEGNVYGNRTGVGNGSRDKITVTE